MPTKEQKNYGKKSEDKYVIGWTSVVGELLHAGHHAMLKECKEHCDFLYCGIISDPTDRGFKNKPVQSLFERYMLLEGNKYVDQIVPLEGEKDLELALRTLSIDVRFVGADYIGKDFTGKDVCEQRGIKIFYNSRAHGLSSSELRKRVKEAEEAKEKTDGKI